MLHFRQYGIGWNYPSSDSTPYYVPDMVGEIGRWLTVGWFLSGRYTIYYPVQQYSYFNLQQLYTDHSFAPLLYEQDGFNDKRGLCY